MANVAVGIRNNGADGTTPLALRLALAALFPQAGILSGLGVRGSSSLAYSVAAGVAVCTRGAGGRGGTGAGSAADARANLGFNASNLTSEDLNALIGYTETKSYYGGGGNTVKNKPDNVDAFSLTVLRSADGWTSQVLVSSDQNPGIYYRSISSSTVQPWKRIYDYNSPLPVANGGTGATDAAQARANIGAAATSHSNYLTTSGTAAAANKLATARTISLAGDVTGSAKV